MIVIVMAAATARSGLVAMRVATMRMTVVRIITRPIARMRPVGRMIVPVADV